MESNSSLHRRINATRSSRSCRTCAVSALDEAFDQDVRERELLEADWVIDARKAYAVALDAYAKAQAAEEANAAQRRRNLESIDAALERLQWLQSIQAKFNLLENQP